MHHILYRRKRLTEDEKSALCIKCQVCCRYDLKKFDRPHRGLTLQRAWGRILLSNGRDFMRISYDPCQHIKPLGCSIYNKRPELCREFMGGDRNKMLRPICLWYEPISEDEKCKLYRYRLGASNPLLTTGED